MKKSIFYSVFLLLTASSFLKPGAPTRYIPTLSALTQKVLIQHPYQLAKQHIELHDTPALHDFQDLPAKSITQALHARIARKVTQLPFTGTFQVNALAFNPDGTMLASGSYDSTLRIWDVNEKKCLQTIEVGMIRSLAFRCDSQIIACGCLGESILLWDVASQCWLPELCNQQFGETLAVAFSPSDKNILACTLNYSDDERNHEICGVNIWNASSGKLLHRLFRFLNSKTLALAFNRDGTILAAGFLYEVGLWNVHTGERLQTLSGLQDRPKSIVFNPDAVTITAVDYLAHFTTWNIYSGIMTQKKIHDADGYLAFLSPDAQKLATTKHNGILTFHDITTGKNQPTHKSQKQHITSVAFHPKGTDMATGHLNGNVDILETYLSAIHEKTSVAEKKFLLMAARKWRIEMPYAVTRNDPVYCALVPRLPFLHNEALFREVMYYNDDDCFVS